MKKESKYDKNYVENLIVNEVEENLHLEYKSGLLTSNVNSLSSKLTKVLSSFANSDGGTLILGIKEYDQEDKSHLPEKATPIDKKKFPKERIEQLIQDNTSPKLSDLDIIPIEYEEGYVYVIKVPQSTTAHQAKDLRYYRRMNFKSEPMNDYEIRDIMNRSKQVKLKILPVVLAIYTPNTDQFQPRGYSQKPPEYNLNTYIALNAKNIGKKTAKHIIGNLYLPPEIHTNGESIRSCETKIIDGVRYTLNQCNNMAREVVKEQSTFAKPIYSASANQTLIPYTNLNLTEYPIFNDYYKASNKLVKWEIYCDESEPIIGSESIDKLYVKTKYL